MHRIGNLAGSHPRFIMASIKSAVAASDSRDCGRAKRIS